MPEIKKKISLMVVLNRDLPINTPSKKVFLNKVFCKEMKIWRGSEWEYLREHG